MNLWPSSSLWVGGEQPANGPALEAQHQAALEEAPPMADPRGYERPDVRYPANGWESPTPTDSYIATVKRGASTVLPGNVLDYEVVENRGAYALVPGSNIQARGSSFTYQGPLGSIDSVVRFKLGSGSAFFAPPPVEAPPPPETDDPPPSDPGTENVSANLTDEELEALDVGDPYTGEQRPSVTTLEQLEAPEQVGLSPMGKAVLLFGGVVGGYFLVRAAARRRRKGRR